LAGTDGEAVAEAEGALGAKGELMMEARPAPVVAEVEGLVEVTRLEVTRVEVTRVEAPDELAVADADAEEEPPGDLRELALEQAGSEDVRDLIELKDPDWSP